MTLALRVGAMAVSTSTGFIHSGALVRPLAPERVEDILPGLNAAAQGAPTAETVSEKI